MGLDPGNVHHFREINVHVTAPFVRAEKAKCLSAMAFSEKVQRKKSSEKESSPQTRADAGEECELFLNSENENQYMLSYANDEENEKSGNERLPQFVCWLMTSYETTQIDF
jgi:hypothetical protein